MRVPLLWITLLSVPLTHLIGQAESFTDHLCAKGIRMTPSRSLASPSCTQCSLGWFGTDTIARHRDTAWLGAERSGTTKTGTTASRTFLAKDNCDSRGSAQQAGCVWGVVPSRLAAGQAGCFSSECLCDVPGEAVLCQRGPGNGGQGYLLSPSTRPKRRQQWRNK